MVGLAIGALLAVADVYMGLKAGWWDSGSITASLLAFALFSVLSRARGQRSSRLETNLLKPPPPPSAGLQRPPGCSERFQRCR